MSGVAIPTAQIQNAQIVGAKEIPPRPFRGPWLLQVVRSERLSSAMQRIVLGGDTLTHYPADCAGAHLKVLVPRPGQEKPNLPVVGEGRPRWEVPQEERPFVRTYTVRAFDTERLELTLDFVLHAHGGPAAAWAKEAKVGNWVAISGPGERYEFPGDSTCFVFAGDLSALPAISAQLEHLPADAQGVAFLEVKSADEIVPFATTAIPVQWLVRDQLGGGSQLAKAVRGVHLPETVALFAAGEAAEIGQIRAYVRGERGIERKRVYLMPFWKQNAAEEIYHGERHVFMDEDPEE